MMLERILLVDDSESDALLLQRALRKAGFEEPLHWLPDPWQALAYLKGDGEYADREKYPMPELLLLDLRMPAMHGLEFLRRVKSHPELNRLVIIVVTGLHDTRLISEAYRLGAHSYLAKDSGPEEFQNFVNFVKGYARICKPPLTRPGTAEPARPEAE